MKLNGEIVPWYKKKALMSNRLTATDKCPRIQPIGIGECLCRILDKCMIMILSCSKNVTQAFLTDQLCGGLKSGIKGGIHFMKNLFRRKYYAKTT